MTTYLVEMTVVGVDALPASELEALRAAESVRAAELADAGVLLRLWRPVGEGWRNVGLWSASDPSELEAALASLPLADHLEWTVRELGPHPNDPAPAPG